MRVQRLLVLSSVALVALMVAAPAQGADEAEAASFVRQLVHKALGDGLDGLDDAPAAEATVSADGDLAVDDALTIEQDSPVALVTALLRANDDPSTEGRIMGAQGSGGGGLVSVSAAGIAYEPNAGFVGVDTFEYFYVGDDENPESDSATVTVTVTAAEEPVEPEALVATDDSYELEENSVGFTLEPPVTDNDTGTIEAAVIETQPEHGALNQTSDTTFQYTPDPGFDGADSFTYRAEGPGNDPSNVATVTLTVTPLDETDGDGDGDGDDGSRDGDDDDDGSSKDDDDDDGDNGGKLPDTGGTASARLLLIAMLTSIGGLFLIANTRRRIA
jgi:hypothetical protein